MLPGPWWSEPSSPLEHGHLGSCEAGALLDEGTAKKEV